MRPADDVLPIRGEVDRYHEVRVTRQRENLPNHPLSPLLKLYQCHVNSVTRPRALRVPDVVPILVLLHGTSANAVVTLRLPKQHHCIKSDASVCTTATSRCKCHSGVPFLLVLQGTSAAGFAIETSLRPHLSHQICASRKFLSQEKNVFLLKCRSHPMIFGFWIWDLESRFCFCVCRMWILLHEIRRTKTSPYRPQRTHSRLLTSAPVSAFQIFTNLSEDPLAARFPSRESATESTSRE